MVPDARAARVLLGRNLPQLIVLSLFCFPVGQEFDEKHVGATQSPNRNDLPRPSLLPNDNKRVMGTSLEHQESKKERLATHDKSIHSSNAYVIHLLWQVISRHFSCLPACMAVAVKAQTIMTMS